MAGSHSSVRSLALPFDTKSHLWTQAHFNLKEQCDARFNPNLSADLRSMLRHDLYKRPTKHSEFVEYILSYAARRGIGEIARRHKVERFIFFLYVRCCFVKLFVSRRYLFYVF